MTKPIVLLLSIVLFTFAVPDTYAAVYDMLDSANWNVRFDGATAGDQFSIASLIYGDYCTTGKQDILVGSRRTDFNSRADSGSFWSIPNAVFAGVEGTGNVIDMADADNWNSRYDGGSASEWLEYALTVTGTVSATDSVTPIAGVEFALDNNDFDGLWTACEAVDGSFNSTAEDFSCTTDYAASAYGSHVLYIRAYDTNLSYTAEDAQLSIAYMVSGAGNQGSGGGLPPSQPTPAPVPVTTPTSAVEEPVAKLLYPEQVSPQAGCSALSAPIYNAIVQLSSAPYFGYGSTGAHVQVLQRLLNMLGFTLAYSGPGSAGFETNYFGYRTHNSLSRFQEQYRAEILQPLGLRKGTGYFGRLTRAKINT